jgi:hypothetical protein
MYHLRLLRNLPSDIRRNYVLWRSASLLSIERNSIRPTRRLRLQLKLKNPDLLPVLLQLRKLRKPPLIKRSQPRRPNSKPNTRKPLKRPQTTAVWRAP